MTLPQQTIPVVLFAYARPDYLRQTLACLREDQVPLIYVFADGPKNSEAAGRVYEVRSILHEIDWCDVRLLERKENFGLGKSILTGVTEVFQKHDAIIVFEDDLICVPGTYNYLCAALEHYKNDLRVLSVTGWTHPLTTPSKIIDQPYFDGRGESWCWGSWARAWKGMEQDATTLMRKCEKQGKDIYRYGADLPGMAKVEKEINIWAIRFLYLHILNDGLCLRPPISLIDHIGTDSHGTNVKNPIKWDIGNLGKCPPIPRVWPDAIENPDCWILWQKECGAKPSNLRRMQLFIQNLTSSFQGKARKIFKVLINPIAKVIKTPNHLSRQISSENQANQLLLNNLSHQLEDANQVTQLLLGKLLTNQIKQHGIYDNIHDTEFKVFSQFGDDGILQYLIHQTQPTQKSFIEFGVQNYSEANTRFLLFNDNWKGLIIDSDKESMEKLEHDELYWKYDLKAVSAFITRENINQLFLENGFRGEIGLLSVDIDGNDYWVWEKIESVSPVLVTIEYNSLFGIEHAITIPYDPTFYRTNAHSSNLYWGASLKALSLLAEKKGYAFVGCNSNGNNSHFVRKDMLGNIPVLSLEQGYMEAKYRESRDSQGNLTYLAGKERLKAIKDMDIYDVEKGLLLRLGDLFSL